MNDYVTPRELSEKSGISVSIIRRLMKDGELEFIAVSSRTRQIRYSSWLDFIERNTRRAKTDAKPNSSSSTTSGSFLGAAAQL